jgi:hypothetical protein
VSASPRAATERRYFGLERAEFPIVLVPQGEEIISG